MLPFKVANVGRSFAHTACSFERISCPYTNLGFDFATCLGFAFAACLGRFFAALLEAASSRGFLFRVELSACLTDSVPCRDSSVDSLEEQVGWSSNWIYSENSSYGEISGPAVVPGVSASRYFSNGSSYSLYQFASNVAKSLLHRAIRSHFGIKTVHSWHSPPCLAAR